MAMPRRLILVVSSVFLLLLIAVTLATAIEARIPSQKIIKISVVQEARLGHAGHITGAKALLNGTEFDRGDVWHGTSIISGGTLAPSAMTETQEGMIGFTQTAQMSASWILEGVIGPVATPTPSVVPAPQPQGPHIPIIALTYTGSGGPKHCRGELLQQVSFPPPIDRWRNGTCINLPGEARCGVFFASKGDNCEAQLFNTADCYNTTRNYVNTVVFMPEERAIGALWSSMWIKCGVEVPEAKLLDPSILGGLLKKPNGG